MRKTLPVTPPPPPLEGGKKSPSKPPPDPAELLRKEVDIMRSLRHPNIVALHEASRIMRPRCSATFALFRALQQAKSRLISDLILLHRS